MMIEFSVGFMASAPFWLRRGVSGAILKQARDSSGRYGQWLDRLRERSVLELWKFAADGESTVVTIRGESYHLLERDAPACFRLRWG